VVEIKSLELEVGSEYESDLYKGKWIIDAKRPSASVPTTKVQLSELEEQEEGEHLFHSQI